MAAAKPCTNTELVARVVALESNLAALRQVLDERDERYKQRADSQDSAVATALATSEKAVNKAEMATEKRLEGLNELRAMTQDQTKTFARTDEMKLVVDSLTQKIQFLDDLIKSNIAHGGGIKDAWGYFAVAAGLVLTSLAVYFHSH